MFVLGQNDIKKLRRENEQLRREIWSLRDEYDKLEEIVKKQKNREESDEPEVGIHIRDTNTRTKPTTWLTLLISR